MSTAGDCPETRGSLVRGERKWSETSNCVIDVETSSPSQLHMLGCVCATGRSVLASMPSCICNLAGSATRIREVRECDCLCHALFPWPGLGKIVLWMRCPTVGWLVVLAFAALAQRSVQVFA